MCIMRENETGRISTSPAAWHRKLYTCAPAYARTHARTHKHPHRHAHTRTHTRAHTHTHLPRVDSSKRNRPPFPHRRAALSVPAHTKVRSTLCSPRHAPAPCLLSSRASSFPCRGAAFLCATHRAADTTRTSKGQVHPGDGERHAGRKGRRRRIRSGAPNTFTLGKQLDETKHTLECQEHGRPRQNSRQFSTCVRAAVTTPDRLPPMRDVTEETCCFLTTLTSSQPCDLLIRRGHYRDVWRQ